jgi:hypothetical protein
MASLKGALNKGLISLKVKRTTESAKEGVPTPCPDETYPYGTRIELRKEQIEALGLKLEEIEIGSSLTLVVKANVVNISKRKDADEFSQELGLQLTDMKVE